MAQKIIIPEKYRAWIEAQRRYHLSDAQVQMARELGLNPHKFGKLANEKQEPWKKPLPEFIEEIYYKRFGRKQPEVVRSIEQMVQDQREKKAERKTRQVSSSGEQSARDPNEMVEDSN
jgi:hypothetical protein